MGFWSGYRAGRKGGISGVAEERAREKEKKERETRAGELQPYEYAMLEREERKREELEMAKRKEEREIAKTEQKRITSTRTKRRPPRRKSTKVTGGRIGSGYA